MMMEFFQKCSSGFIPFLYTLFDVCTCFALTIESGSALNADVICDRQNQTGPGVDELPMYCQNGGKCVLSGCGCAGGFYGTVCQHSVINAVIVVVVCILPPASWTLVFCYGFKERRRKRLLRQQRRQQRSGINSRDNVSPILFAEDLPPSYSEISYDNPIAVCGMDEVLYQSSTEPPPPNYDDVLKKAIECGAILPLQAIRYSQYLESPHPIFHTENEEQETQIDEVPQPSSTEGVNAALVTAIDLPQEISPAANTSDTNSHAISSVIVTDSQPHHTSREELIDDAEESESDEVLHNGNLSIPVPSSEHSDSASGVIVTSTQPFYTSSEDLIENEEETDYRHQNGASSSHVTDGSVRTLTNELPRHDEAYTNQVGLSITDEESAAYTHPVALSMADGESSALSSVVVISSHPLHSSRDDLLAAE